MTQTVALDYLRDENRKNSWVANIKAQRDVLKANLLTVPLVQKVYPLTLTFFL